MTSAVRFLDGFQGRPLRDGDDSAAALVSCECRLKPAPVLKEPTREARRFVRNAFAGATRHRRATRTSFTRIARRLAAEGIYA